jgi:hypothetical protein
LSVGQTAIGLNWVFKLKKNSGGDVIKHKAHLIAKGYVHEEGIDFEEVFASVARIDIVHVILAIAASRGWQVHFLDVRYAFLNGELEEEVYVAQLEGFTVKNKEHMVFKLQKALYGLQQAPCFWYSQLDQTLKKLHFTRCALEQTVYKRGKDSDDIIVSVYDDDLIVTREDPHAIAIFKQQMMGEFDMSDLGSLTYYLVIEVEQDGRSIAIKQSTYTTKLLIQCGMMDCYAIKTPMEPMVQLHNDSITVSSGAALSTSYKLDFSFTIGVSSRFMERLTTMHQNAVKKILHYLKGTIYVGLDSHWSGSR